MTVTIPKVFLDKEKLNTGTSVTGHSTFDELGYLPIEQLWDPSELICSPPEKKGQFIYNGKSNEIIQYNEVENQVKGSTARILYPQYRYIHTGIRLKIEKILGCKLHNTYYYDRFYLPGQELTPHTDRPTCEISVTLHVSTNLNEQDAEWPFCIKDTQGNSKALSLEPGDAVLYKGCERPHWRTPMPKPRQRLRDRLLFKKEPEYYYHQIFFHYVLANGERVHYANEYTS